ncbi:MAG: hypothetical protein ABSG41_05790 [Bryobacteraceae bacterium]|jgi:hypothetical protein
MTIYRKSLRSFLLCVASLFAVAAPASMAAGTITFTFTADGSGTIGATPFADALVTVTAIGDTSAIFEAPSPPFEPDIFFSVPSQFDVSIAGVGTADFTGTGYWGGNGYVFDNQTGSGIGFGIESDDSDNSDSAFATYNLSSSIGPISSVSMNFSDEATTLGLLTLTTVTPGTFAAQAASSPSSPSSPEPVTFELFGVGLVALRIRQKRTV